MDSLINSLLTGNLGYGTIIIILGLFYAVYVMFIVPRLKEVDVLENKVTAKDEEIKGKDVTISSQMDTVNSMQKTIEALTENLVKQENTIQALNKISTLETTTLKIPVAMDELCKSLIKKLETVDDAVRERLVNTNEAVVKQDKALLTCVNAIEELSSAFEANFNEIESRLNQVESLCREIASNRASSSNQVSVTLSTIQSELSQMRGLVATQRNQSLLGNADVPMQEIK